MTLNEGYLTHLLRYVGVGLISGSIVHAGTLGGAWIKYIILIALGAALFAAGVWFEHRHEKQASLLRYTGLSVAVSIGTGMVSGATQHYLDGPIVAAVLLPLGLLIGYTAFAYRDYKLEVTSSNILKLIIISVVLGVILLLIGNSLTGTNLNGH